MDPKLTAGGLNLSVYVLFCSVLLLCFVWFLRAESRGDEGVIEARHRLRTELQSSAYKESLRHELMKNIEKDL